MANKKPASLKTPTPLNTADKEALARILKKARAFKAYYREHAPLLLKVPKLTKREGRAILKRNASK